MTRPLALCAVISIAGLCGCQACSDCLDYSSPVANTMPSGLYESGPQTAQQSFGGGGGDGFYSQTGDPLDGIPAERAVLPTRPSGQTNMGSGARDF